MDAGLAVACLSLVLSAGSIGWQVATRHLDGGRVRLRLVHGVVGAGGVAAGAVGRDSARRDLSRMRSQGFMGPEVVGVAVTNVGRAPVRIDRYSVRLKHGGFAFIPVGDVLGANLPHRLEPGETETWYAEVQAARALVHSVRSIERNVSDRVRMTVELGTGDVKRTRRTLAVGSVE
ncbi:phosphoribosylamine--glycine ligase [Pengzhenrongella frigida]|uniref:Phosphoribosylamine--glycine ligase n=1 Tax=Pengzhenrongella frigida TaxID=1259133 RepID=A0A4Q5MZ75_9MICO|nr:phosphoribosylamine--glycine ligase [Cellulomonas sp. HLT2-17]RYV51009.1 phosphoribosylamine--glycine ligase [Cellulomonas sp. HLT2-17]